MVQSAESQTLRIPISSARPSKARGDAFAFIQNSAPSIEQGRSHEKCFCRKLQTTEADLTALFQPFGLVGRIHIVTDRETGRARGFARDQFR